MYEINHKTFREFKQEMYMVNELIDRMIFLDSRLSELNNEDKVRYLGYLYNLTDKVYGHDEICDEAYTIICDRMREIYKDNEIVSDYMDENPWWMLDIFDKLGVSKS